MFSKACEYAIKATLYIAIESQDGRRVNVKAVAKGTDSPEAFIAKILQQLVKNNIIRSTKGPTGGFEIDTPSIEGIKISQIVKAIDGDSIYTGCALGLKACSEINPCPMHEKFKSIRNQLKYMLENTSIQDMIANLNEGTTVLRL